MTRDDIGTRHLVAIILGVFGVVLLLDVLVIALVQEGAQFDGVRQLLTILIGALLIVSGVLTFNWPRRHSASGGDPEPPVITFAKEPPSD